ncbi:hypothetical protein MVEN_00160300 [Mycena venus]|uniref:DUF6534 domain-containing protein n=1 Tax=Mycena venus TaxID=2733690 RepID=A0A8H6YWH8_9AGAR|nr:hypothetical protein MVEN_00160300 [Mycena venus]
MSFNADLILGALLVGTWANSVLYTVEIIQAAYYYRHFKYDNWILKLLVSSAITIDSVSMIANYSSVYLYTITHWGDLAYVQNQYWASQFGSIEGNVIKLTGLSQSFLTVRYWRLTKNKFITVTLFFFITVAAGGAFASGVTIAVFPEYKNRRKVMIPATTWLITEAVTDISIASALLWEFWKAKSSFKETRSMLNRLVAQTIQTGTAGATIALAVLVAFLANKESNVPSGIAYCLGRVYCITMLANLNLRKTRNGWSGKSTSSCANLQICGERGNQERTEGGDEYGIRVSADADDGVIRTSDVQRAALEFSRGSFKTNPGQGLPNGISAIETEMKAKDSASSQNKQDLFAE